MAAALRTNGTGSVSSNAIVGSLNVPIGSGVKQGDLIFIVAAFAATGPGTTFTTPTGYTIASATTDTGATNVASIGTFYRIADGTEAGTTVTVTHSVTARCAAVSAAFSGTTGTFDVAIPAVTLDNGSVSGQSAQNSPTLTGLTGRSDIAVLLMGVKQDVASATAVTFTPPAGYTSAISASGTASAGINGAACIAYKAKSDATDETSPAWATNLAVHWLSVSVAGLSAADSEFNAPPSMQGPMRISLAGARTAPQAPGWDGVYSGPVRNTFESGSDQAQITPANSGNVPIDYSFSTVVRPNGVPVIFDATNVMHGTLAGKLALAGAPTLSYRFAPMADGYGRLYIFSDSFVGSTIAMLRLFSGGAQVARLIIGATGGVSIVRRNAVTDTNFTTLMALNTYYRVEWHHNLTQQLEVKLFLGDNPYPLEQRTAGQLTEGVVDEILFGNGGAGNVWYDDINAGATAWPGASVPTAPLAADYGQPLSLGGLGLIPGFRAVVPPQPIGTEIPVVTSFFSVPVAQITASGPTATVLSTHAPPEADVVASAPVPTLLATPVVPVAQVTASGPTPVMLVTFLPPVAQVTVVGLLPSWQTTAAAAAQSMRPFGMGGPPTIPGSMAILRPQEPGDYPATFSPVAFAVPVAQVTASGPVPVVLVTFGPPVAVVTVTGPTPTITGLPRASVMLMLPPVKPLPRTDRRIGLLHGVITNIEGAATVRGLYTFSSSYSTGGETVTFPIQRYVLQAFFSKTAGGYGIVWTGSKVQAWNLDGSGNLTTEVAATTDLSSVTVPIVVYVIAH